jgi:Zn-dependent protease
MLDIALHLLVYSTLIAAAIILHEVAHGYAALALGDETALRAGRLTLNPLRHVDRVGTVILPALLVLGQLLTIGRIGFMFGWAKPVPVDAMKFRAPRQMMALVALAGPAMNFALAFLAAHLFRFASLPQPVADSAMLFIQVNLLLGMFNLLPMPPLDGGRIMVGLLPPRLALLWVRLEPIGLAAVMLLILAPTLLRQFGIAFDPLSAALDPAMSWGLHATLWLAGVRGNESV